MEAARKLVTETLQRVQPSLPLDEAAGQASKMEGDATRAEKRLQRDRHWLKWRLESTATRVAKTLIRRISWVNKVSRFEIAGKLTGT